MKNIQIKKMERLRSINLRIGFAAALLLTILAFNWTTQRPADFVFENEDFPKEVELKAVTFSHSTPMDKPPASTLKPNDLIIEVPDLAISTVSTSITTDSVSVGAEPGNVTVKPTTPVVPPKPPAEEENDKAPYY